MKLLPALLPALACVASLNAFAASYEDAMLAFENHDYETARHELEPLVQHGDLQAMTLLGRTWDEGFHNLAKALPLYRQAAERGDADAQVQLAEMYDAGEGVAHDPDLAIAWYERAARQGHEDAQVALGLHYSDDLGDNPTALDYFRQAADQGNAVAQYYMGLLYLGEPGVERDEAKAWLYLSLAADRVPDAANVRDVLELNLGTEQMAKAQQLLKEWQAAH